MKKIGKILLSLGLAVSMTFNGQYISGVTDGSNCVTAATKVKINKTKASIYVGKTVQLKVTGTKKKVTWKSSNKKIATVTSKGKVKGVKKGTAKITATVSKKKYVCKVTVKNREVEGATTPKPTMTVTPMVTSTVTPTSTPTIEPTTVITLPPATPTPPVGSAVTPTPTPVTTTGAIVPTEETITPIVAPTTTPETNTVADNINKLKKYITENGSENSSGNKFINWIDNADGTTYNYAIIYENDTDNLHFLTYIEGSSKATISMYVDATNNGNVSVEILYLLNSSWGYKATATLNVETYSLSTDVNFECDPTSNIIPEEKIQSLANTQLRLAFSGWDILLMEKVRITLSSIGFISLYK